MKNPWESTEKIWENKEGSLRWPHKIITVDPWTWVWTAESTHTRIFSIVDATVLHDPQLWILTCGGNADTEEPQTQKADYSNFQLCGG